MEEANESGPNLGFSKFLLTNICPVFVPAFIFELPRAARKMCIKYGGMQASETERLKMLRPWVILDCHVANLFFAAMGKMRWYHALINAI